MDVLPPGTIVGQSDPTAGNQLGLGTHSVAVGVGMIDAMAGCLGCLATSPSDGIELSFPSRFSMICGTSTCHLVLSRTELFIPAIWGPYDGAVLPDLYLNEAGQNAVGPILDWLITSQAADIPQLKVKNKFKF